MTDLTVKNEIETQLFFNCMVIDDHIIWGG